MQYDASDFSVGEFSGRARIFPLPGLVVFPHVVQALHIFEPRYVEMLRDTMDGDKLFAMALLEDGWQHDYEGRPAVHPGICLGRVLAEYRNDDGTSNVLFVGQRRARLCRELDNDRLYREAEVELLEDTYESEGQHRRQQLQEDLISGFRRVIPNSAVASEHLDQILGEKMPLSMLTDLVAYSIKMSVMEKQSLLEEIVVERRAEVLIRALRQVDKVSHEPAERDVGFPPPFSAN